VDDPLPDPTIELVEIFSTGDAGLIAVVKSILEGEGIDYLVRGEGVQDLLGAGRLSAGFNYVTGPARFMVRSVDADRVGELLNALSDPQETPPEDLQ
jgi:hypothetical protein